MVAEAVRPTASQDVRRDPGGADARNPRGGSSTPIRIREALRRQPPGQAPSQLIAALLEEASRHAGGGVPPDGMKALLIARKLPGVAQG